MAGFDGISECWVAKVKRCRAEFHTPRKESFVDWHNLNIIFLFLGNSNMTGDTIHIAVIGKKRMCILLAPSRNLRNHFSDLLFL
jgi:hypothetical protein